MKQLVDSAWLEAELGRRDLCILDCSITHLIQEDGRPGFGSGRSAWADGHIPGSHHVDLIVDLSDQDAAAPLMMPPAEQLRTTLESVGVADGKQIVLYDNNLSMWAARVWWMLQSMSVDAAVLDGGWQTWTREGRAVETGDGQAPSTGTLTVVPRAGYFASQEDVLSQITDGDTCLIDALQPKVFRGERQDYSRPGHIPGARNVPAIGLVDRETHKYLPLDTLREKFSAAAATSAEQVITYCGAGVAGASAAFALRLIGVRDVAVYDGSLNEWAADPALPMTTSPD